MAMGCLSFIRYVCICMCVGVVTGSVCVSCHQVQDTEAACILRVSEFVRHKDVHIHELTDSIGYVALETSDRVLLGDIVAAKFAGGYYFVQDSRGLYIFTHTGKFVSEVGRRGVAPEEYVNLDCFYIDERQGLVGIVSGYQKKIVRYTFDGKFHSALSLEGKDVHVVAMMPCGGDSLLAHFPLPNDAAEPDMEYGLFSQHGTRLIPQKLLEAANVHSGAARHPFSYYPMTSFRGEIYFIPAFSNLIYTWKDNRATARYAIDAPDQMPDEAFLRRHEDLDFFRLRSVMREEGTGMGITGLEATDDYLFVSLNNEETLIWDGEQGMVISSVYNPSLNTWANLLLAGGVSDEHVGVLQADFLYVHKEQIARNADGRLAAIVRQLREDDNPVLYRYYFKKSLFKSPF